MKKAFTLAEVLITLGIVGVVASMTLPAILQKNQKTTAVNRLKKIYSQSLQALVAAQREDDPEGIVLRDLLANAASSGGNPESSNYFADVYIKPYFKVVKDYGHTSLREANLPKYYPLNGVWDSDAVANYSEGAFRILVLSDGTIMYIGTGAVGDPKSYGIVFEIDINGVQKPNVRGKDVFCMAYYPTANVLKMLTLNIMKSRQDYLNNCNAKASTIPSRMCGALIQHDGWAMKNDYPW